MDKVKVLIVDDEPLAAEVLESHMGKFPHLQLEGQCRNADEAIAFLNEHQVDVIFLDIQMPQTTGIEFMKQIESKRIPVVFVTAYPEYAVEAFNLEALDYMVKPVSLDRFRQSIERLEELLRLKKSNEDDNVKMENGHIFVKADSKFVKLGYDEILYVEAFADYVKIYTSINPDKRIITLQTMKNMENTLPADKFVRVHRSYIVSISKVTALSGTDVHIDKKSIPIGKNYKEGFFQAMDKTNFLK